MSLLVLKQTKQWCGWNQVPGLYCTTCFWISGNKGILRTGTIDPEVHRQLVLWVKKKALKITFIESSPSTFSRNLRCSTWSSRKNLISLFKYHLWHYTWILIRRYYLGNILRRNKSLKFLNFADLLPFIYYSQMPYVGSWLLSYGCQEIRDLVLAV